MRKRLIPIMLVAFLAGARTAARADDTASEGTAASPRVAKIALNEVTIVAEKKGWLKEEFDKNGASAKLVPCSVGVVPALMDRGDVDIANSMAGHSFIQLLNGFNPVIVWQSSDVDPRTVVIVVLKDSPIKSLADLKGKTLGVAQWTCGYYAAYESMNHVNLPLDTKLVPGQVRYLNLNEGRSMSTLLLSGKVDAVAAHPIGLAPLYLQGVIRDLGTAVPKGKFVHGDRIVYFSPPRWTRENPDLIRAFIRVQEKSVIWIRSHPSEAAEIVGKALRQPKEIVEAQFREAGNHRLFLPETDYAAAIESFKSFQKLALSNSDGLITEARKNLTDKQVEELFDRRFFRGGEYYPGDGLESPEKSLTQSGANLSGARLASSVQK